MTDPTPPRPEAHRLADAIIAAAADYRRTFRRPVDEQLTAGVPTDLADGLAELLAPHHIIVWTPDPTAELHLIDADTGGPAKPLERDGSSATVLLWAGDLVVGERTAPIDLTGPA